VLVVACASCVTGVTRVFLNNAVALDVMLAVGWPNLDATGVRRVCVVVGYVVAQWSKQLSLTLHAFDARRTGN